MPAEAAWGQANDHEIPSGVFVCLEGPASPGGIDCDAFDLNNDGFVDLLDVTLLLESY